jgi:predicted DsbA family dithiol-disulfide isomerase
MKIKWILCMKKALLFLILSSAAYAEEDGSSDSFRKKVVTIMREEAPQILMETQVKMMEEADKKQKEEIQKHIDKQLEESPDLLKDKGVILGPKDKKLVSTFVTPYCPHCKNITQDFLTLLKKHPEFKVALLFVASKEDKAGHAAARALMAASKLGKFEELFKAMLKRVSIISEEEWVRLAKEVGLETEKFEKIMNSSHISEEIEVFNKIAQQLGLSGMPTVIYKHKHGGHKIIHGHVGSPEALKEHIEK